MEKEKKTIDKPAEAPEVKAAVKKPAPRRSKKKRRRAARIGLAVTMSVLLILLVGAAVAAVIMGHRILNSDKTLPNVMIGEVAVGGMTKEEVAQTLRDHGWDEENGGTLTVTLPADIDFQLDYYEAGVSFTPASAQVATMLFAHPGSESKEMK